MQDPAMTQQEALSRIDLADQEPEQQEPEFSGEVLVKNALHAIDMVQEDPGTTLEETIEALKRVSKYTLQILADTVQDLTRYPEG